MNKITFGQWCEENNHRDFLDRWDYEKNNKTPYEVSITDKQMYYFKCPRNLHESELSHINKFHTGKCKNIHCKKCESFAQVMIDKIGEEEFWNIWDPENTINPWDYSSHSKTKGKFLCYKGHTYEQGFPEKAHQNQGCPYCSNRKICKENSLGVQDPFVFDIWSDKNSITPYDLSPSSGIKVWWKCKDGKHEDYYRSPATSRNRDFVCPQCAIENIPNIRRHDLIGQIFGEWTVLSLDEERSKNTNGTFWWCKCSCGEIVSVYAGSLTTGESTHCTSGVHKSREDNPNWRGGITSDVVCARATKKYEEWRDAVYAKDWYTCQCCGRSYNIEKQAHHISNFSNNIEKRFDVDNGITLCKECHYSTVSGSFHNIYGTSNNTPEQLEEFINNKRKLIGLDIPFTIENYINGEILKPKQLKEVS